MSDTLGLLAVTAAGLGFLHAALGPDHYLPFALLARAGRWSRTKTLTITLGCGLGHILSSVLLGGVGIALGMGVAHLQAIESRRGEWAVWALIAFGLIYLAWGLRRAARHRPHSHLHAHADGTVHQHEHVHQGEHLHVHSHEAGKDTPRVLRLTPWALFILFVFGPCEPLIPLLLVPATQENFLAVAVVIAVFGATTLATMLAGVSLCLAGFERLPLAGLERYTHALAGAALALCGAAIGVFGL